MCGSWLSPWFGMAREQFPAAQNEQGKLLFARKLGYGKRALSDYEKAIVMDEMIERESLGGPIERPEMPDMRTRTTLPT